MNTILVVTKPEDFPHTIEGVPVVSAKAYLTDQMYLSEKKLRVYNLCRYYRYQSAGYYVSLLAEARGHQAWPSVPTLQDFRSPSVIKSMSDDLYYLIQKSLKRIQGDSFVLSIYFGQNLAKQYESLAKAIYHLFEAPMLRVQFAKTRRGWMIESIKPISLKDIPDNHKESLVSFAKSFFAKKAPLRKMKKTFRPTIAFLLDSEEKAPPSDPKAIKRFMKAADEFEMDTEVISKNDYHLIPDFDGLFIRATTSVTNFTYRFSRKAWADGLIVLDDPQSIVRCTNKVYLAELMQRNKVPTPKTLVIHRENLSLIPESLGFPVILKQPDSSFSQGVTKASDPKELSTILEKYLTDSDFVIAQEYLPTQFDWRIGVLNKQPLYACKYYMARGHWQIYNWDAKEKQQTGKWDTFPLEAVPPGIVKIGLKAANLIGSGFYGVDIKETPQGPVIIEVNDNPSIESDVEDKITKDGLYQQVMGYFAHKISEKRGFRNG